MDCSLHAEYFLAHLDGVDELPERLIHTIRRGTNQEFLDTICTTALQAHLTESTFVYFEPLAFEICARWNTQNLVAATQAYARILPIYPHLSGFAYEFFSSVQDLNILSGLQDSNDEDSVAHNRSLLLAVHRLLNFDNESFAKFILPARLQMYLHHNDLATRHLAIKVLCQYIHASDATLNDMKVKYLGDDPGAALGNWDTTTIDYEFLSLWEIKRLNDFQSRLEAVREARNGYRKAAQIHRIFQPNDFSPRVAAVAGTLLPRTNTAVMIDLEDDTIISNTTTNANLRLIADALTQPHPLLLTGLAGSGKTALTRHIASKTGKASSMVTLHLNEQSDAKLLIGLYTTGREAGSFTWQPGVLTTAVNEGRWVFIEDLDRAPSEVMSTLLPLIERGELLVPSRGQKLKAAPGFKIIATMRSVKNSRGEATSPMSRMLGRRLWKTLYLDCLTSDELKDIISAHHPPLSQIINPMMAAYDHLIYNHDIVSPSIKSDIRDRPISSRELLKWAGRVSNTLREAASKNNNPAITEADLDSVFLDAVDCFAGNFKTGPTKDALTAKIARDLHIDPQRMQYLLENRAVALKKTSRDGSSVLRIGRSMIPIQPQNRPSSRSKDFALNGFSLRLLERVAVAVHRREPLLLVGETGIGKTAAVQHLAQLSNNHLTAINLSQQSEAGDLLGGLKPVNARSLAIPLKDEFDPLFDELFSQKKNREFSEQLSRCISKSQWKRAAMLWKTALQKAQESLADSSVTSTEENLSNREQQKKRRKIHNQPSFELRERLNSFASKLEAFQRQIAGPTNAVRFAYTEGKLVTAVRQGHWVLLDEINLASPDTLECLSDLLESGPSARPFLILAESGGIERIDAHPNFRIFGAMNPATDVGKKDLPLGIRSRFSEIFVDSPDNDSQSLQDIAKLFLERLSPGSYARDLPKTVTDLYQQIQNISTNDGLEDGSAQPIHFSLRTLIRALGYANVVGPQCSVRRALYEGFCLCFLTCLNVKSEIRLQELVKSYIFPDARTAKSELKKSFRPPKDVDNFTQIFLRVEGNKIPQQRSEEMHWLPKGPMPPENPPDYIVTPYVSRNLRNLIRVTFARKHPVLIQGPTSAGKTSMVEYLAKRSGNKFVRINNHEHTDLQEYLGTYVSTPEGQLVFQEGVLVQAVRQGHWIVLDELNLAPTDVLEALNRLLDDNRELLIPETQEIIKPHKDFMLFATQNPAGPYGGRKFLSRAFRNRFVELHFDDIPVDELNIILAQRSQLPESWCGLIVEVYRRLSTLRQEQRLFEANSFATLRDLFRWAFRGAETVEQLAAQGYMLLAAKVRKSEERESVKHVIEQVMTRKGVRINLDEDTIFSADNCPEMSFYDQKTDGDVLWTRSMRRLFSLTAHAIRNNEAVLLVGETGCGKTTVCQMLAQTMGKDLHTVNAHQNTETGDLIGAQRPIRNRSSIERSLFIDLSECLTQFGVIGKSSSQDTNSLLDAFDALEPAQLNSIDESIRSRILSNKKKFKALFEWNDGSLVQAMRSGSYYLLDEISLAEDSVLERLNSVLDPSRSLLLAEKGTTDSFVVAQDGFQFFATMNPGGDFGKKELSPALRNRFTEIWVPPLSEVEDVLQIVEAKLEPDAKPFATVMVKFAKWFGEKYSTFKEPTISVRDLLAWIRFVNSQNMPLIRRILHGAAMVYIDTIGANPSAFLEISSPAVDAERTRLIKELCLLLETDVSSFFSEPLSFAITDLDLTVGDFSLARTHHGQDYSTFYFDTPRTKINAMRIIRALQGPKPVLIEGSPGVGKSSIVAAIANATGRALTRINLSEQTDLMDLFGSDVPVQNAEVGLFTWIDAPFLTAMKRGDWVLMDEMNLASQSVLEGLNACLDHRAEIYISELDQTFSRHPEFRLFAAQNPHHQGGGRKGLPSSFVNRFTVVYADAFQKHDLELICERSYPSVTASKEITKLVEFVTEIDQLVTNERKFGIRGAPWEFNLRDLLRWLQLVSSEEGLLPAASYEDFVHILFLQRFRTSGDAGHVKNLFHKTFGRSISDRQYFTNLGSKTAQVGLALTSRVDLGHSSQRPSTVNSTQRLPLLESLMLCVQNNWPALLVGSSGSGKSHLLMTLASIFGVDLEIFALNADTDANDLVGGFEQVDQSRQVHSFLRRLRSFTTHLSQKWFLSLGQHSSAIPINSLLEVQHLQKTSLNTVDFQFIKEKLTGCLDFESSTEIESLIQECDILSATRTYVENANFEWVDGILVEALETGRWLVLDHANLCSSSVLDRLNSLLEPNGSLLINENCDPDGTPRLIKPHPSFRIFLTVDPDYGEVSRAMRNRAVEMFVPALQQESSPVWRHASQVEPSMTGFLSILNLSTVNSFTAPRNCILEAALDRLSLAEGKLLDRFVSAGTSGLLSADTAELLNLNDMHQIRDRLFGGWQDSVYKIYDTLGSHLALNNSFALLQPVHMLVNQPLIAMARRVLPEVDIFYMGMIQEVFFNVSRLYCRFQKSEMLQSLLSQRSRLSMGKTGSIQDPVVAGSGLFQKTQNAVLNWIKGSVANESYDHMMLHFVRYLQSICQYLLDSLLNADIDEMRFKAFLQSISNALDEVTFQSKISETLKMELSSSIARFSKGTELKTGLDMEILWQLFRPLTAPDSDCLHSIITLEKLADKFDEACWHMRVPFTDIQTLHTSITKTIDVAYRQKTDVHSLVKQFNNAFQNLRKEDSSNDIIHQPWFRSTFELLCQRHEIFNRSSIHGLEEDSKLQQLYLLSCRKTKTLKPSYADTVGKSALALITEIDGENCVPYQSEQDFWPNLSEQLLLSKEVVLDQVDMLQVEIQVLGIELSTNMNIIVEHIGPIIFDALTQLIGEVVMAHKTIFANDFIGSVASIGLKSSLMSLSSRTNFQFSLFGEATTRHHELQRIFAILLHPFSTVPASLDWSSRDSFRSLSNCLIGFSLALLLLYIPNKAFDPALKAQIERDMYDERKRSLEDWIKAYSQLENYLTESLHSTASLLLENEISNMGNPQQVPSVVRPPTSQLDKVQTEFNNTLRIVQPFFDSWSTNGSQSLQDSAILDNISSASNRLNDCAPEYRDLTVPAIKLLKVLKVGLAMNYRYGSLRNSDFRNGPVEGAPASFLPGLKDADFFAPIPHSWSLVNFSNQKRDLLRLKSLALRSSLELPLTWPATVKKESNNLFFGLYSDWKAQLERDRKAAEKASSFYHYRGGKEENEEEDEEEFRNLFPTFEETSDVAIKSHIDSNLSPQDLASQVAELHLQIFLDPKDDLQVWKALLIQSSEISGNGSKETDQVKNEHSMIPAIILRIHHLQQELSSGGQKVPNYNFYTDPNTFQARRITNLVHEIQDKIHAIVEIWPEHETLRNVLSTCTEILAFRRVDPVVKFLTKAEKLHDYLAEWQSVASREYSAEHVCQKLTDLLISWRQLELSTWMKLLDLETEKCDRDARAWWFMAYENIYAIPDSDVSGEYFNHHISELLGALDSFMTNSSVGQFREKLRLLESLTAQLSISPLENEMMVRAHDALESLVKYHSRFSALVEDRISTGRQELEKQIKDVLQLASWNDRNVHALKESAKISHRKLFRVVRKYRELLSQPVSPLLAQDMPPLLQSLHEKARDFDIQLSPESQASAVKACQLNSASWKQRPARMKNISTTVAAMQSKTEQTDIDSTSAAARLDSFLETLENSTTQLQKETPAVLSEDNLEVAKHITSRKRRLFADTLKEVRAMGMTSNLSADIVARQRNLCVSLSTMSAFPNGATPETAALGNGFMLSTLHLMDTVRKSTMDHHDDISKAEILRSVGLLESFLAFSIRQHNILSAQISQMQDLDRLLRLASNIWGENGVNATYLNDSSAHKLSYTRKTIIWLPSMLRLTVNILSAQAELGHLDFSDALDSLSQRADEFADHKKSLLSQPILPENMISHQLIEIGEIIHASIESLLSTLDEYSVNEPTAKARVIFDNLKSWIQYQRDEVHNSNGNMDHQSNDFNVAEFDDIVTNAIDLVLGSIQDVEGSLNSAGEEDFRAKGWLTHSSRNIQSTMKSSHIPTVTQGLQEVLQFLSESVRSSWERRECFSYCCASLTAVLPIFQTYREIAHASLIQFADLYRSTCKANYKLAKSFTILAAQGFCKPSEKSGDRGTDSEKLESGTGLGEGEGAEDISKDIGDDEDLSELAQDQNNQTKAGEMGKEDDAVDIKDALEGAAGEDAEEAEEEEKESREDDASSQGSDVESQDGSVGGGDGLADEESATAQDDEIGDVDDLGPSAVDEKLWDQPGEDSRKEKQGKESSKNADKSNQDATAEEDGNPQEQPNEPQPEDGQEDQGSDVGMSDVEADASADEGEGLDPHLKESEAFDLPEELQLDGDKSNKDDADLGDSDDDLGELEDGVEQDVAETAETDKFDADSDGLSESESQANTAENEDEETEGTGPDKEEDDEANGEGIYGEQDGADQTMELGGEATNDAKDIQPEESQSAEARGTGPEQVTETQKSSAGSAQRESGAEMDQPGEPQAKTAEAGERGGEEERPMESRDMKTVKQLGNALEQWHRQHREIREAITDRPEEWKEPADVEMADNEFEHLPNEDTNHDAQALGAADEEQAQALDDRMAIASENKEQSKAPPDISAEEADIDEDIEMHDTDSVAQLDEQETSEKEEQGAQSNVSQGAFVGERKVDEQNQGSARNEPQESEDLEEVDDQLSTMHINPSDNVPPSSIFSDPLTIWQHHEARTYSLSQTLTAQLRLILEPTLATKLRGDFRTGKRLNIKRIIPYIASRYKRDKIWMRRSVPTKRAYQVMLAIDDSRSMAEPVPGPQPNKARQQTPQSKDLAFDTLALLSKALTSLEAGELAVLGFGETVFVAHDFSPALGAADGASILRHFSFAQTRTDVTLLLRRSIDMFADARRRQSASSASRDLWQLQLIVSDGICEDHEGIRRLLVRAKEERILVVFVVVDAAAAGASLSEESSSATSSSASTAKKGMSILDLETVEFVAWGEGADAGAAGSQDDMRLVRRKYLDTFPFSYYLVVKDVMELPHVLATALRQWFAEIAER